MKICDSMGIDIEDILCKLAFSFHHACALTPRPAVDDLPIVFADYCRLLTKSSSLWYLGCVSQSRIWCKQTIEEPLPGQPSHCKVTTMKG